jgi:hypothetical protein
MYYLLEPSEAALSRVVAARDTYVGMQRAGASDQILGLINQKFQLELDLLRLRMDTERLRIGNTLPQEKVDKLCNDYESFRTEYHRVRSSIGQPELERDPQMAHVIESEEEWISAMKEDADFVLEKNNSRRRFECCPNGDWQCFARDCPNIPGLP